MMLIHMDNLTF